LVVFGGTQLANALPAPSLNCKAAAGITFNHGTGFASGVPGLFVDDGPAAKVHDLSGEAVGTTTLTIALTAVGTAPNITYLPPPISLGQPMTLPGGLIVYVTGLETNQYYPTVPVSQAKVLISHATTKAILAGGTLTVDATDGTHGTALYNATENSTFISLFGSGCTAPTKEIYPTTLSGSASLPLSSSNAFTGLESKSQAVTFPINYPTDPSGVYGVNNPPQDTVTFGAGHGTFNTGNGVFTYSLGKVTGPFATASATASLGLDGAIICTSKQLSSLATNSTLNPIDDCDGGKNTASAVDPAKPQNAQLDTLAKLLSVEEYYGTAGACLTYATPCTPNGSDGTLLTEAVQLDLGGNASL
jgi:hypothetical protein